MKVLFLDFDGPLFPDRYIKYDPDNRRPYPGAAKMPQIVDYWKMDPMSVQMLNFLHDLYPFTTVVSSSWKRFCDRKQVEDLFAVNGLMLNLYDHDLEWSTPDWKTNYEPGMYYNHNYATGDKRSREIKMWIEAHDHPDYLILDDPWSGSSLDSDLEIDNNRVIMVDPDVGISSIDYQRMLDVVKVWADIKTPRLF